MAISPTTPSPGGATTTTPTSPGGGTGGSSSTPPPAPATPPAPTPPANPAPASTTLTGEQANMYALLYAQFKTFGLESLAPRIIDYIVQGYSGETVAMLLRDTPEYQARFPAMAALRESGRAIQEVDYVNYEINAAQLEQRFGLPKGYLTDSSTIATLLTNNVSGDDLVGRVQLNAAAQFDAPPELRATLKDYYGLDANGSLTAYYLDPEHSLDYLNRQMAAAKIGASARRQSIALGVDTATLLEQRGISAQQADQGFAQVASLERLQYGAGDVADQDTLVAAAFGDAAAAQAVERAQKGRTSRFAGGGGAAESQSGIVGLGR